MSPMEETADERVRLDPWEEIVGTLDEIQACDEGAAIRLSAGTIVIEAGTNEAKRIQEKVDGNVGEVVGILRVGSYPKSFRVEFK